MARPLREPRLWGSQRGRGWRLWSVPGGRGPGAASRWGPGPDSAPRQDLVPRHSCQPESPPRWCLDPQGASYWAKAGHAFRERAAPQGAGVDAGAGRGRSVRVCSGDVGQGGEGDYLRVHATVLGETAIARAYCLWAALNDSRDRRREEGKEGMRMEGKQKVKVAERKARGPEGSGELGHAAPRVPALGHTPPPPPPP